MTQTLLEPSVLTNTSPESLREYFEQFGEVVECTVMRDSGTGRSRGFGFLTFKDAKTVNIVMVKEHFLDGKIVRLKRYFLRPIFYQRRELIKSNSRLTPREPSQEMNRKRLAKSLLAVSAKRQQTKSSETTLPNSEGLLMPHS